MPASIYNIARSPAVRTTSTWTDAAISVGAATTGRYAIPLVLYSGGTRLVTSLTVNGVTALPLIANHTRTSTITMRAAWGKPMAIPDGDTTASVAVTLDGTPGRVLVILFTVTGVTAQSAVSAAFLGGSTAAAVTAGANVATYADGITLAGFISDNYPTVAFTGTDASPVFDSGTTLTSATRWSARTYLPAAAESAHNVSAVPNSDQVNLLSLVSLAFDNGSATPKTVSLTDMQSKRIVQRVPGTNAANLKVNATFTAPVGANPADAQCRVMNGATVVLDWTVLTSATINNGTIAGILQGIPVGSGYTLQLRTRDGSGTVIATANGANVWSVGILGGIIGSSSADNYASIASSETIPALASRYDGVADLNWVATLGGPIRAIANQLLADVPTLPVGFISYGLSGTFLNQWQDKTGSQYLAFINGVLALEGKLEFLLIPGLGVNDVKNNNFFGYDGHLAQLRRVASNVRADLGQPDLPVFFNISQTSPTAGSDINWYDANRAEKAFGADASVYLGMLKDLVLGGDQIHPIASEYIKAGKRTGVDMLVALRGKSRPYLGPDVASFAIPQPGVAIISYDLKGAGSLVGKTAQTGITGYRASLTSDFASLLTITSAKIVGPNQVRIDVSGAPTTFFVDYMYGANPDITNPLYTNGAAL